MTIIDSLWQHCNTVACYAVCIAKRLGLRHIVDQVFLTGLLHDLGKIILLTADESVTEKIAGITSNRDLITATLLEEISVGIGHSTLGSLIATKWKFPDYLIGAINLHHTPLESPEHLIDIVYVTYLANMLSGLTTERYFWFYIEEKVLARFGLGDKEAIDVLLSECRAACDAGTD